MEPGGRCGLELGRAAGQTSGVFTCLVTAGEVAPFLEDSDSKAVVVAVVPAAAPAITGLQRAGFTLGDFLSLNCSTQNVSVCCTA